MHLSLCALRLYQAHYHTFYRNDVEGTYLEPNFLISSLHLLFMSAQKFHKGQLIIYGPDVFPDRETCRYNLATLIFTKELSTAIKNKFMSWRNILGSILS